MITLGIVAVTLFIAVSAVHGSRRWTRLRNSQPWLPPHSLSGSSQAIACDPTFRWFDDRDTSSGKSISLHLHGRRISDQPSGTFLPLNFKPEWTR